MTWALSSSKEFCFPAFASSAFALEALESAERDG
jgi:hypothetical protein